ncbi:MAG: ABC transporter permease [Eubacterium sp.]|nr:ABC transporter permease [Eubacterium sp.]
MTTAEGISNTQNKDEAEKKNGKDGSGKAEGSGGKAQSTNGKNVEGSAVDEMDEYGEKIGELKTITEIFSKSNANDLKSFRKFLESDESKINDYTSAIEYRYSIVPLIYREDDKGKFRQVNPDNSFAAVGLAGSSGTSNNLMSMMMSTDSFWQLPADEGMYKDQYDVVAGHWPEDEHDLTLVLSSNGEVSDLVLFMLGERDPKELEDAVKQFAKGEEVTMDYSDKEYDASFFMGQEFRLIKNSSCYKYDADKDVYIDKRDNRKYMNKVAAKGDKLTITGIVKPKEDASITPLTIGFVFHPDLIEYIIDQNRDSDIVQAQLDDRGKNVLTGKDFGDDDNSDFDFEDMVTMDKDALKDAFKFDAGKMKVDPKKLPKANKNDFDFSSVFSKMKTPDAGDAMSKMMTGIMKGFAEYVKENYGDALDPEKLAEGFAKFMQTDQAKEIAGKITQETTQEELTQILSELYEAYIQYAIEEGIVSDIDVNKVLEDYMKTDDAKKIISTAMAGLMPDMSSISKALQKKMTQGMANYMSTYTKAMMKQIVSGMKHAMSINPDAFAAAFKMDMDEDDLTQMITQLMTTGNATYEDNMKNFGYADLDEPSMIQIYPKNFESKEEVINIIDSYNDRMKKAEEDDKVITYSDIVGALMSSVTEIINQLSMVLIAFVAISLVVSSIMIGVITYISVLERKKEIGILRAMGASKGNVANVFNAETFIIGALAGLLGIGISYALMPLENFILQTLSGGTRMYAMIPADAAVVLVLLSIVLTLIGGWIPSRKAANSDPVTALRTE